MYIVNEMLSALYKLYNLQVLRLGSHRFVYLGIMKREVSMRRVLGKVFNIHVT